MDSERFQRYKLNEDIEIFSDENESSAYYKKGNEMKSLNLYYFDYDDDYRIFHSDELFVVFVNNEAFYYPENYAIEWENDWVYPFSGEEYGHLAFNIKKNKMKLYVYCKSIDSDVFMWIDVNKIRPV